MKPLASLKGIASWLIRLIPAGLSLVYFVAIVQKANFNALDFYFALIFSVSSILLLIGAFFANSKITVLAAFLLLGVGIIKIFLSGVPAINSTFMVYFTLIAVGFYFAANGNK